MRKNWFSKSNILNAVFILTLLSVIFVPTVKTLMIRGLMSIGFFNPDVSKAATSKRVAVSDLIFSDPAGQTLSLHNLKGKVVVINFWATWCPPCRAELPSLNSLYEKFKANKDIVFITVDADGDFAKSAGFLQSNGYTLPLYKIASNVEESVYAGTLPTTVIIDTEGKMVLRHQGAADYDSKRVIDLLKSLIAKN
ncbi:thioredoxin [Mucilaginibacter sp. PAMC 26640]|nr:thioredoxin [Mucilaginibacter sp. PAMC 26640]